MAPTETGKVSFVGAGPGDPGLLTARAAEVLAAADCLVFDREVHPDVLALSPGGVPRSLVTPEMSPERVALLLASHARAGAHVVRVVAGDALLFGRADLEAPAVAREGIPIEVVPGLHPLLVVSALAGVPLTSTRDASPSVALLEVTRGHESLHDWEKLATATDTLAIHCDASVVAETARSLVFHGRNPEDPAALVEAVSLPEQRTTETTLGQVPLAAPARSSRVVLVVGAHARRVSALAWLEKKPLFGKRVLVTRARDQAGAAARLLRERGAFPILVPTIEIHPPSDPAPLAAAVRHLAERDGWVVVTSANGVETLWNEVRRQGKDARVFGRSRIAAIGPGTAAALAACGLAADLVPGEHRGEALAAELLAAMGDARPRVLVARAEVARDIVPDALRAAGCAVDVVATYKTCPPPPAALEGLAAALEAGEIDAVTFTSSSTVSHFCEALGERAAALLARTCVASISPVTSATARARGVRVDVEAGAYTMAGLVDALEAHFNEAI
jgi:uroporphyrinogen III methyltransferase/synthase